MPGLIWVALLLGYFAGVAVALFLLPAAIVEPFIGRLFIASIVIMAGASAFFVLQRRRADMTTADEAPRSAVREGSDDEAADTVTQAADDTDGRVDDVAGDSDRLRAQGARRLDPFARAADGSISPRELRQILYDGRIEILARPVRGLPGRSEVYQQITARLIDHQDQVLSPSSYNRTVARCGLEAELDRVRIIRALQMVEAMPEPGPSIACPTSMRSLTSTILLDGLEEALRDGIGQGERLILELDRLPRASHTAQAIRRLARLRVRLALRRLSLAPTDLEQIAEHGFHFVRVATPSFADGLGSGGEPGTLGDLLAAADRAGVKVVVDEPGCAPAPLLEGGSVDAPLPQPPATEAADDAA